MLRCVPCWAESATDSDPFALTLKPLCPHHDYRKMTVGDILQGFDACWRGFCDDQWVPQYWRVVFVWAKLLLTPCKDMTTADDAKTETIAKLRAKNNNKKARPRNNFEWPIPLKCWRYVRGGLGVASIQAGTIQEAHNQPLSKGCSTVVNTARSFPNMYTIVPVVQINEGRIHH